jgi:Zn-dependent metalloprotease
MNILYLKLRILFVAMIFINYCAIGQFTLEHILPNLSDQKLKAQDLTTIRISSQYEDPTTGFKHVYLEQQYNGVPIYPIQMSLHFDAHDQLMHKFENSNNTCTIFNNRMCSSSD